jgi:hypothetical protein
VSGSTTPSTASDSVRPPPLGRLRNGYVAFRRLQQTTLGSRRSVRNHGISRVISICGSRPIRGLDRRPVFGDAVHLRNFRRRIGCEQSGPAP